LKGFAMPATDTIRIRIEPQLKHGLQERCEQQGTTLSQVIRDFLKAEAARPVTALERFDAIMQGAEQKNASSGVREPDIDEINRYIEDVRAQRLSDMNRAS
jgi:antitoxin component of RelBE/YafQ-DinJ toxin-antitoxin module